MSLRLPVSIPEAGVRWVPKSPKAITTYNIHVTSSKPGNATPASRIKSHYVVERDSDQNSISIFISGPQTSREIVEGHQAFDEQATGKG